jgi:hypothetical protein
MNDARVISLQNVVADFDLARWIERKRAKVTVLGLTRRPDAFHQVGEIGVELGERLG